MRIVIFILFLSHLGAQDISYLEHHFGAMGTQFDLTVVAESEEDCRRIMTQCEMEVHAIEKWMSSWKSDSETSKINRNAGMMPVEVSDELLGLIQRSIQISRLTQGAFDISYASVDKIWTFDRSEIEPPTKEDIRESIEKIGYEKIILDAKNKTVFLQEEGMKIGFGAIGKGYTAMKIKELMKSLGALGGIVNAGGDLYAWGQSHRPEGWRIAVADPRSQEEILAYLELNNQAIVTSGDYERYALIDGVRHAHIIDPRTGWPTKGLISVTVIAHDAELADALATSIFVMGRENGLYLINQLDRVECILVDDEERIWTSDQINLNYETANE